LLVFAISVLRGMGKAGTLFHMGTGSIILLVLVCGAGLPALFAIGKYNGFT
jgi:hypothetical protein